MKALIHHVRRQPDHIRHWTAIGCTAAVGAVVVAFWFHSFQTTTYSLLNGQPEQNDQTPAFADNTDSSLFGSIGEAISSIKAQIGSLFGNGTAVQTNVPIDTQSDEPVYPLPVTN
jgi:hypothetical protein